MASTWKNVLANIKRERMISFSSVFVMTITFILLGLLLSTIVVSQTILKGLEKQAQITVFFKDDFGEDRVLQYRKDLEGDKRISYVKYVSKEDAFRIFSEINKDEPLLLESISASILPSSLEIRTEKLKDLSVIAEEYKTKEGVEEVRFFQDIIDKFRSITTSVYIIGAVLVLLFFIISYSIIIATIRSTIHSKGVELEILKLVGASNSYVRKPLLLQGALFGTVSSIVASMLLTVGLLLVVLPNNFSGAELYLYFNSSYVVGPYIFLVLLTSILVLSGILLGLIGSQSAVKRYLRY